MSKPRALLALPVVLGVPLLLWAYHAAGGDRPEAVTSRPRPAARTAPLVAPSEGDTTAISASPAPAGPRASARPAVPVSPEMAAIQERILRMEERARELEAKRDTLAASNKDLEKDIARKSAELSARTMAEWRVKAWEGTLGLSDSQKRALVDLLTQWGREDAGGPADSQAWGAREGDLRSQLSVEQAAKLHDLSVQQSQQQWKYMGMTLGNMVGATKDEVGRLQQTIGDVRFPQDMMLPEAHGADYQGLLREAAGRVRAVLSPDQAGRLDRFVSK